MCLLHIVLLLQGGHCCLPRITQPSPRGKLLPCPHCRSAGQLRHKKQVQQVALPSTSQQPDPLSKAFDSVAAASRAPAQAPAPLPPAARPAHGAKWCSRVGEGALGLLESSAPSLLVEMVLRSSWPDHRMRSCHVVAAGRIRKTPEQGLSAYLEALHRPRSGAHLTWIWMPAYHV